MKERVLKAKGHPFNHYLQVDQRADLAYRECVCVSLSPQLWKPMATSANTSKNTGSGSG